MPAVAALLSTKTTISPSWFGAPTVLTLSPWLDESDMGLSSTSGAAALFDLFMLMLLCFGSWPLLPEEEMQWVPWRFGRGPSYARRFGFTPMSGERRAGAAASL